MKRHSLTRRLISSVLLVELVFALAVIFLAAAYERHAHLHDFDIMLEGRADSLLGAVQDADDPGDNVMLDTTGLQLPRDDVYEVRDSTGRLLGRSSNWRGPIAEDIAADQNLVYRTRIEGKQYRVMALHGLRVVDPSDKGGGVPRHILVVYGSPTARLWRQVNKAIVFFSLSSLALLAVTGMLMAWLLHRGLRPMRHLAAEAEKISAHRWNFRPPESAMATTELAPLATALTAAMQRLEGSFSQQRRFVSDAAHELKTAVAVIKSSLQLLTLRRRTAEEYEAGVQVSLTDSERMEEIVARMLMLARAEHQGPETPTSSAADLSACASVAVQQFESMAKIRLVTLSMDAPPEIFVPVSPEECVLLCSNLVLNALQHSPPHTTVKMRLTKADSSVEMRVEDEGDGIHPALLPHVFERFSRGDPSRSRNTGGTGLGLAICKAIVDRAGGSIALESEPDRGTTAIVRLPPGPRPESAILSEPALHSASSA